MQLQRWPNSFPRSYLFPRYVSSLSVFSLSSGSVFATTVFSCLSAILLPFLAVANFVLFSVYVSARILPHGPHGLPGSGDHMALPVVWGPRWRCCFLIPESGSRCCGLGLLSWGFKLLQATLKTFLYIFASLYWKLSYFFINTWLRCSFLCPLG